MLRAVRSAAGPQLAERPAAPGERSLRVAALGGGTGLPVVLSGLVTALGPGGRPLRVSAIVTTADDGGSSGELRRNYGVPSPGDARNCLVALAPGLHPLAEVFQYRFDGQDGLTGHTVGNLVLTALAQRLGDFAAAVATAGQMLRTRGRVLPAHEGPAELEASLEDGRVVRGESRIAAARGRVARLAMARPVPAPREALEAVAGADLVVLGPGSLYSSVIASILGGGMAEALRDSGALRVMVVNLFTQPGETDGYGAADHVQAVLRHAGPVVDLALAHCGPLPHPMVERYAAEGAVPVAFDREAVNDLGVAALAVDLLAPGEVARHDPGKLAEVLVDLSRARRAGRGTATGAPDRRPRR